ncbi:MAG TPA: hypothetical protein VFB69_08365 [Candidatus Dormibacteraeota bacterium]|nr:hypothetical protein [Candidatus Dormibacteraeota bacterium]
MHSINRKQLVALGIAIAVILLMIEAWVPPPAHEVHSIGGTAVNAVAYPPPALTLDSDFTWWPGPATESLSSVACMHLRAPRLPCGRADVAAEYPNLVQGDHTLYFVWSGCVDWYGAGPVIPWAGSNVEYFASTRTLVLHCYVGTGLLYVPDRVFGSRSQLTYTLLAIPTTPIGAGALHIREDDRLEHLVGDQSTEYDLATATVN